MPSSACKKKARVHRRACCGCDAGTIDALFDVPGSSPGPPLLCDQHCCLPLSARADVGTLARYLRPGGSYVSVNVGYVPHSSSDVLALLGMFRRRIAADERYLLAASVREIEQAHRSDRVAVGFEGRRSA